MAELYQSDAGEREGRGLSLTLEHHEYATITCLWIFAVFPLHLHSTAGLRHKNIKTRNAAGKLSAQKADIVHDGFDISAT